MRTRVIEPGPPGSASPPVAKTDVIRTAALTKSFGEIEALRELDLAIPQHSIYGFLGPNGAGKTTAIKLLLGLSRPTAGQATLFGLDSVRDSLEIRARVGYLAQDPRFYNHLTARETLEFTARFFYRGSGAGIRARVDETLELVGLEDKADRPTRGFSGGERQRLGIAQAQINHPDLLILDEPAAALDPVGRRDVLDIMERLRSHTTIFYSTHILDDVERVSDYVTILDRGQLVASAPTATLLDGDSTTYEVVVKGAAAAVVSLLRGQTWVKDVTTGPVNGATELTVTVTDERAAESELLRSVLAVDDIVVTGFGRKHLNLEEVFLQLVKGHGE